MDANSLAGTRAVIYARVSGDDTGKDSRNLRGQIDMGEDYAVQHGYSVIEKVSEDDRGASGAAFELPGLNRVRQMARDQAFEVLVVREIDRLSRNLAKQLIVEEELRRSGVRIEYVIGEYPDSPEGNLMKHVRASVAEYEREKIRERNVRGRRLKVQDGNVQTHGRRIFGYDLVKEGNRTRLEVNEEEAEWVRQMFQWYTIGDETGRRLSIREIAAKLNDLGVPTRAESERRIYKVRDRDEWPHATVSYMLSNPVYIGQWSYGKRSKTSDLIHLQVPAIIDQATWDAAQARRAENRVTVRQRCKHEYLLAGRITCYCGYTATPRTYNNPGTRGAEIYGHSLRKVYHCGAKDRGAKAKLEKCTSKDRRADVVDAVVWEWVKGLIHEPLKVVASLREYEKRCQEENAPLLERIAAIDALLAGQNAQYARLADLYMMQNMPKDVLAAKDAEIQGTIRRLNAERAEVEKRLRAQSLDEEEVNYLMRYAAELQSGLQEADESFEKRRRLIDLLDVHGKFALVDGKEVLDVSCHFGQERLPVPTREALLSSNSRSTRKCSGR